MKLFLVGFALLALFPGAKLESTDNEKSSASISKAIEVIPLPEVGNDKTKRSVASVVAPTPVLPQKAESVNFGPLPQQAVEIAPAAKDNGQVKRLDPLPVPEVLSSPNDHDQSKRFINKYGREVGGDEETKLSSSEYEDEEEELDETGEGIEKANRRVEIKTQLEKDAEVKELIEKIEDRNAGIEKANRRNEYKTQVEKEAQVKEVLEKIQDRKAGIEKANRRNEYLSQVAKETNDVMTVAPEQDLFLAAPNPQISHSLIITSDNGELLDTTQMPQSNPIIGSIRITKIIPSDEEEKKLPLPFGGLFPSLSDWSLPSSMPKTIYVNKIPLTDLFNEDNGDTSLTSDNFGDETHLHIYDKPTSKISAPPFLSFDEVLDNPFFVKGVPDFHLFGHGFSGIVDEENPTTTTSTTTPRPTSSSEESGEDEKEKDKKKDDKPHCPSIPDVYHGTKKMFKHASKKDSMKDSIYSVGRHMKKAAKSVGSCAHKVFKDIVGFFGFGSTKKRSISEKPPLESEEGMKEKVDGKRGVIADTKRDINDATNWVSGASQSVKNFFNKRSVQNSENNDKVAFRKKRSTYVRPERYEKMRKKRRSSFSSYYSKF